MPACSMPISIGCASHNRSNAACVAEEGVGVRAGASCIIRPSMKSAAY